MQFLSGVCYVLSRNLLLRYNLDDPTDSISIHAIGGILSLFLSAFFSHDNGIFRDPSRETATYLGMNLMTIVVLIAWSLTFSLLIFAPLAYFDKLGKLDSCENDVEMREIIIKPDYAQGVCVSKLFVSPLTMFVWPRFHFFRAEKTPGQSTKLGWR